MFAVGLILCCAAFFIEKCLESRPIYKRAKLYLVAAFAALGGVVLVAVSVVTLAWRHLP